MKEKSQCLAKQSIRKLGRIERLVIRGGVYHRRRFISPVSTGVQHVLTPRSTDQGPADIVVRVVEHVTYEYLMHPIHN